MAVPPVAQTVEFYDKTAGAEYSIIPAPFVNINKSYEELSDGRIIGSTYSITLIGTIVATHGSPDSSGNFLGSGSWYHALGSDEPGETIAEEDLLKSVLTKQKALRTLFSKINEGQLLNINSVDGTQCIKIYPRIKSVTFEDGPWHTLCNYTIELEADRIYFSDDSTEDDFSDLGDGVSYSSEIHIRSASENFSLEFQDEYTTDIKSTKIYPLYRATHTVSAVGKRVFENDGSGQLKDGLEAWQHAKRYCEGRIDGITKGTGTLVKSYGTHHEYLLGDETNNMVTNVDETNYVGYNLIRTHTIDEVEGSYSLTETWLIAPKIELAQEEYTVESTFSIENGLTDVTINGTITGFEEKSIDNRITKNKIENAETRWTAIQNELVPRINDAVPAGIQINPELKTSTVSKSRTTGVITYSNGYDNRPGPCVEGELSRSITITDTNHTDVIAQITVLGRPEGPILQDINTVTATQRQVTAEIVLEALTYPDTICTDRPKPTIDLDGFAPGGVKVFKTEDQESWNPPQGRYTRTIGWTYED